MKKLLLGSAALTLFPISILIFQISCKKDVVAQAGTGSYTLPPSTTLTLGGVIVGNGLSVTSNGTLSATTATSGLTQLNKIVYERSTSSAKEIWIANYDGTNKAKVNIILPTGIEIDGEGLVKLSPDGQTLFFTALQTSGTISHIYSCKLDGSDLTRIIDGSSTGTVGLSLGGAY